MEELVNFRGIFRIFGVFRPKLINYDGIADMADDGEKAKSGEVRFTASPQLWAYLDWLSRHTILGKSPSEVAEQVLTHRLSEMKQEDFRADKL